MKCPRCRHEDLCQEFRIITIDPGGTGAVDPLPRNYTLLDHVDVFEGLGHLPIFTGRREFCDVLRRFVRTGGV